MYWHIPSLFFFIVKKGTKLKTDCLPKNIYASHYSNETNFIFTWKNVLHIYIHNCTLFHNGPIPLHQINVQYLIIILHLFSLHVTLYLYLFMSLTQFGEVSFTISSNIFLPKFSFSFWDSDDTNVSFFGLYPWKNVH